MSIREQIVEALSGFLIAENAQPREIVIQIDYEGGRAVLHVDGQKIRKEWEK